MGEILNLRRARKARAREAEAREAAANRAIHGRPPADKAQQRPEEARADRLLDNAKVEDAPTD